MVRGGPDRRPAPGPAEAAGHGTTGRQGPYVFLAAVAVAVPAVCGLLCLRPARRPALTVLVCLVSLIWWWFVAAVATDCRPGRPNIVGASVLTLVFAIVGAVLATPLPVALAGVFRLPPVRSAGLSPGGWWVGIVVGSLGAAVLLVVRLGIGPVPTAEPEPSLPPRLVPATTLDDFPLSPDAEFGFKLARERLPAGERLTTGRFLWGLWRADGRVDWPGLWALADGFDPARLPELSDPADTGKAETVRGAPISDALAVALRHARDTGRRDGRFGGATELLILGILAEPGNGPTVALLAGGTRTHEELQRTVEHEVLRRNL